MIYRRKKKNIEKNKNEEIIIQQKRIIMDNDELKSIELIEVIIIN